MSYYTGQQVSSPGGSGYVGRRSLDGKRIVVVLYRKMGLSGYSGNYYTREEMDFLNAEPIK